MGRIDLEVNMKIIRNLLGLPIVIGFIMIGTACDIMLEDGGNKDGLQASGVVEAIEIVVAPEIGGKIAEVWVSEGDWVAPGDPLFKIDDRLLVSQLHQAESALGITEANLALIAAGLTNEQKNAAISTTELALAISEYDLDKLYEDTDLLAAEALQLAESLERDLENLNNPDFQQALALKAIADAEKEIENAERRFLSVSSSADEADIAAAEAQVVLAKDALDHAKEDYEPYENKPEDNLQRANFRAKFAAAQQVYDAAVRKLNALRGTGSKADITVAEANFVAAKAHLFEAEREWERIKDGPKESDIALLEAKISKAYKDHAIYINGPDLDDVALAEARVKNAKTQLALAKSEIPTQEELDVAKAQVDSARANLEAIQVQIDLLVVKAPVSGVVMTRSIEPGEIIQPALAALTIGQLDNLTITVYISEDKYGQINLGDPAILTADSFPDETFQGTVTRIADRAEYTPRNVQTKEDRQTTVYAIELSVSDLDGKLKPGMPTDVEFQSEN
jgi:multidrug resistance efflux pump